MYTDLFVFENKDTYTYINIHTYMHTFCVALPAVGGVVAVAGRIGVSAASWYAAASDVEPKPHGMQQ